MIDKQRMKGMAQAIGVALDARQLALLDAYAEELVSWNRRVNLTAIDDAEGMETKHFLDCLHLALRPQCGGRVVDVGSGAGFPGMVLKIARPEWDVTLMEPTGKRVAFLLHVAEKLDLNVTVLQERAEEAARKHWREGFDTAVARAVAPLPQLYEYCLPLVKPGGWMLAMKGEAPPPAHAAAQALGGLWARTLCFTLPGGDARSLVMVKKTAPTPARYPRGGGAIKKRPLE